MVNNKYFKIFDKKYNPKLRLFCFPYAGGNSFIYNSWTNHLDDNIELIAIELTGRASRMFEEPINNMEELIDIIYENIKNHLDEPFAFFGHSMGGLIAHALTKKIEKTSMYKPNFLIISGTKPPFNYEGKVENEYLDEELMQDLKEYNETPEELLNSKELMDLILPTLRADYKLIDSYATKRTASTKTKMILFNSEEDIDKSSMLQWQDYCIQDCDYIKFSGNHFFISSSEKDVLLNINTIYTSHLNHSSK